MRLLIIGLKIDLYWSFECLDIVFAILGQEFHICFEVLDMQQLKLQIHVAMTGRRPNSTELESSHNFYFLYRFDFSTP